MLLSLKWRTRCTKRMFTRFVHFLDSQVALSVLVKGRSSSRILNRAVKRCSALTLAASLMPCYGYVGSKWNPSDIPSRLWESGRRKAGSFPRRTRKKPTKRPAPPKDARGAVNRPVPFDSTRGFPGEGPQGLARPVLSAGPPIDAPLSLRLSFTPIEPGELLKGRLPYSVSACIWRCLEMGQLLKLRITHHHQSLLFYGIRHMPFYWQAMRRATVGPHWQWPAGESRAAKFNREYAAAKIALEKAAAERFQRKRPS